MIFITRFDLSLHFFMLAALSLASASLSATARPGWVDDPPIEDKKYKYYIGYADQVSGVAEGYQVCFQSALNEAIRENFGFETQINTDTYNSAANAEIMERINQISKRVQVRDFERVDVFVEKPIDFQKINLRVLYRFLKSSIKQESDRLLTKPFSVGNDNWSIMGDDSDSADKNLGGIEVATSIPLARVFLNDDPLAMSPVRIKNQIKPGRYRIRIDHPNYETIDEDVVILPNTVVKIKKTLKPGYGRLSIRTNLEDAMVTIDGVKRGRTPLTELRLECNRAHQILVQHENAYDLILSNYRVEKNVSKAETLNLTLKTGRVSFYSPIAKTKLEFDGHIQKDMGHPIVKTAGSYNYTFIIPGYQKVSGIFKVIPGKINILRVDRSQLLPIESARRLNRFSLESLNSGEAENSEEFPKLDDDANFPHGDDLDEWAASDVSQAEATDSMPGSKFLFWGAINLGAGGLPPTNMHTGNRLGLELSFDLPGKFSVSVEGGKFLPITESEIDSQSVGVIDGKYTQATLWLYNPNSKLADRNLRFGVIYNESDVEYVSALEFDKYKLGHQAASSSALFTGIGFVMGYNIRTPKSGFMMDFRGGVTHLRSSSIMPGGGTAFFLGVSFGMSAGG